MTVDDLRRRSLDKVKDLSLVGEYDFSDFIYNAIIDMQTETLCSKTRLQQTAGSSSAFSLVIAPSFTGTATGTIAAVEPVFIDALWVVDSGGTYIRVYLVSADKVQQEKDYPSGTDKLYATVTFDTGGIKIFTPWDLASTTFEVWFKFKIPYIADANVVSVSGTDPNLYLETIPGQFQDKLITGIKFHAYEALEEMTGAKGAYVSLVNHFQAKWYREVLPWVKQEMQNTLASETIRRVTPYRFV